jgi:anti-anti-sigma factor
MICGENAELTATGPELLRWSVTGTGDEISAALGGEVDLASAPALAQELSAVLAAKPIGVTIDVTELSYLDSSGIRCLCLAAQEAAAVGCRLLLRNPSPTVLQVLEITGVDELLLHDGSNAANDTPLAS